ncbi:MAG: glycosyl hydrolase 115 family protein, partial [Paludibacter sp.]|nr:glycosyl hydrolase 115 family protein [Paludibacter sp.]
MMRFNHFLLFLICSLVGLTPLQASRLLFERDKLTSIYIHPDEKEVVHTAYQLLKRDVEQVVGAELKLVTTDRKADIIVRTSHDNAQSWETFSMKTTGNGKRKQLLIEGSDDRAKAYGIMELSREAGVSPWHYFADVKPQQRNQVPFPADSKTESPSVRFRGIFINDEDWGLMPWATKTLASESAKGAIGPEAYEKIFELMLRLRANTIWPAMHECTVPFYFVKGNKEMADKYGIVVGTSHCEPLARNSAGEWDVAGKGEYNFLTNKQNVVEYWSDRLSELKGSENIFTIGMRGKHDGMMQGVKTLQEHKNALSGIIPVQQNLIREYIGKDPSQVPQVFIPYKEVLDVYNDGLDVPEHVTLIWCDDNYGYIKRLSDEKERLRPGSSGVYYHISYWGRPHDYLWLATTSPSLIYTEMKRAYDHGADRLWIVNAGDIKPAEYLIEYFMDMAWNIQDAKPGFSHLHHWMEREFGVGLAEELTAIKKEYYRLASIRKPEFMGWSRVEEPGFNRGRTPVYTTEYNQDMNKELTNRLTNYLDLEQRIDQLKPLIPQRLNSAFYQLIEYPVRGASLMNQKWLYAQLARELQETNFTLSKEYEAKSLEAYHEIDSLTRIYNSLENGKWNHMMDFRPRSLAVFEKPDFSTNDFPVYPFKKDKQQAMNVQAMNASQADNITTTGVIIEGLGHSFSAVQMMQGDSLQFTLKVPVEGTYNLRIATLPNHDVDGKGMKIKILVDGNEPYEYDYKTVGRSESWKQNVLRGQALTTLENIALP